MSRPNRYPKLDQAKKLYLSLTGASAEDRAWSNQDAAFALWFSFLSISPSYELATRFRANDLSDADRMHLPADFDQVLSVYDDLGSVKGTRFDFWWLRARSSCFGHKGDRPSISTITTLSDPADLRELLGMLKFYVEGTWQREGKQDTLLLAVPLGLPKRELIRHFCDLIDDLQADHPTLRVTPPKYELGRSRQDVKSLFRYLNLVWTRADLGKPLWRVGYNAGFSGTYTNALQKELDAGREPDLDLRNRMKMLTSRGLRRALMLAENAARGVFPSYEDCPHAVTFKAIQMYDVVKEQQMERLWTLFPRFRNALGLDEEGYQRAKMPHNLSWPEGEISVDLSDI